MRWASVGHHFHRSEGGGRTWKVPLRLYCGKYWWVTPHLRSLTSLQYDTSDETHAPDIADVVSPLTVTSLLSIGGFAGTFMPLPSRTTYKDYSNVSEDLVDRLISCPSEKAVEVNFNLASKTLWSSFVISTLRTTNNQSRIYILPNDEPPGGSPNISTSSSDAPTP